jgi:hypothetical protein
VVSAPRASGKREARPVPSASATATVVAPREMGAVGPSKPLPREDFIRDL